VRWIALIAVAGAIGCKAKEPQAVVRTGRPGATGTARIFGTVRLSGAPPPAPRVSRGAVPGCGGDAPQPQTVWPTDGAVPNAFVWAREGVPAGDYPVPAEPVVVDQRGCEYLPRVAGVRAGQRVAFQNDDQALHNVHALGSGSNAFNFGMPLAGMRTERLLTDPQVMVTVTCDVHPWMRAYLGVVQHPFFAVTAADGRYELRGLPAGRYTIEAWQEQLARVSQAVPVGEGGSAALDFALAR
jgi:plastocyanin